VLAGSLARWHWATDSVGPVAYGPRRSGGSATRIGDLRPAHNQSYVCRSTAGPEPTPFEAKVRALPVRYLGQCLAGSSGGALPCGQTLEVREWFTVPRLPFL
jgi:hypothetical protein